MKTRIFNVILLLILGVSLVSAQEPSPRGENLGKGCPMERFRGGQFEGQRQSEGPRQFDRQRQFEGPGQFINLTDEQKEATKTIHLQTTKALKPLQDELRELEAHHQTLATAEKPDLKKINDSLEKIGAVKVQVAKVHAKQQVEFRALLTEEQVMKFDRLKERPLNKVKSFRRG